VKLSVRLAIAALILVLDFGMIVVPLVACYAAYVIVRRPPSFLGFVVRLYGTDAGSVSRSRDTPQAGPPTQSAMS
jgi:hypothetical protein